MKILFVAPYVPSRIRVRSFHFLCELAKRHQIYVVALGECEAGKCEGVEEVMNAVHHFRVIPHSHVKGIIQALAALPSSSPMCSSFCRSGAAASAMSEIISTEHPDLIHIEHLRAAHFAPQSKSSPVLFDSVDCLTGLFRQMAHSSRNPIKRLIMLEETLCLRRYEPKMLRTFDHIIITSESELCELHSLDNRLNIDVIPNGVDTEYFSPMGSQKHPARIIFSGKMSYAPNAQAAVWFAENVFPVLCKTFPDVEYIIAGSGPPACVRQLSDIPNITVTGYVDDLRLYLDSSCAAIAPMQVAVGVQNKVLEAMAMGLPAVISSAAARAFAPDCPGIIRADTASEVIDAISQLITNPKHAMQIGQDGRWHVIEHFSWQSSVTKLECIYDRLCSEYQVNRRLQ